MGNTFEYSRCIFIRNFYLETPVLLCYFISSKTSYSIVHSLVGILIVIHSSGQTGYANMNISQALEVTMNESMVDSFDRSFKNKVSPTDYLFCYFHFHFQGG